MNLDLKIKTIGDTVEINAKHNEKQDAEGSIWYYSRSLIHTVVIELLSREFTRKYHLPIGVNPLDVKCDLTGDGILIISGTAYTTLQCYNIF